MDRRGMLNSRLNGFLGQYIVIGREWIDWDTVCWNKYEQKSDTDYDMDEYSQNETHEEMIWRNFIKNEPSEFYKDKEWVEDVCVNGMNNLTDTLGNFIDTNYKWLDLIKKEMN